MNILQEGKETKIGYMPLAHEAYWKFFPEHKQQALNWAKRYKEYLSQFGTVYDTGNLIDSQDRAKEARLHFQAMDVDVLVLTTVTYSTPDDVVLDLKMFPRPTIVWNTQSSSTIPDDMNFDKFMLEHGVTGVPGITNLLEREKMPYFLISGHYSSKTVNQSFSTVLKAIQAAKTVWGSRIGIFGHLYPGMIDFGYDPSLIYTTFGVSTIPIGDSKVVSVYKEVPSEEVAVLEEELRCKYNIADEFKREEFSRSVQLALAMKRIVEEERLDAASVYCQSMWQHPEIGVVSCIGNSLLMREGIFFSCEGDVPTALSGMILNSFSRGQGVFTEIWSNDFDNDYFMMGHSGQMNLALFDKDTKSVKLSRHPWWEGCHGRGACLQVKMPTGEVTLLGINPTSGGCWRMVVTIGDITNRDPVPLGAPNFFMKMRKPIPEFLEELGEAGAAHHFAMAYGNWSSHLKAFAKLLKVEFKYI